MEARVLGCHARKLEAETDIFRDGAPGQKTKLLEDHSDTASTQFAQIIRGTGFRVHITVAVMNLNLAADHRVETVDGSQQGRFSGARKPHQNQYLALMNVEAGAGDT